jgi:hypothetical protein
MSSNASVQYTFLMKTRGTCRDCRVQEPPNSEWACRAGLTSIAFSRSFPVLALPPCRQRGINVRLGVLVLND